MGSYAKINLSEVKGSARDFGLSDMGEAGFARRLLGAERIGLAHYRMNPDRRVGFGHRHNQQEEVYVVVAGSGQFKVDDEIFPVQTRDVVFCPPGTMRGREAGAEGLEMLAFGEHRDGEAEMKPGW